MLAKIVSKRDDGKSSFKSLSAYISELRDHVDPETGEVTQKGVATETNCHTLETAWIEMWGTSARSVRVRNPVEHIVLSWEKGERPTDEQAFEAGRMALDALGMADHQYMFAAHRDTDNDHLHIMVNKVHPERGQVPPLKRTHMTLDKTMREIELRQGWRHTNGPFAVKERDGKKVVDWKHESAQARIAEREAKRQAKPGRARDMEAFTGNESLAEYVQGDAKKDALAALDNGGGWQELHSALFRHGLAIKPKGPGFAIHSMRDPAATPVKASTMAQALGGGRLTKRIGEYQEPRPERQSEPHREYTKERPKRDPDVREEQRVARDAERAGLRERYRTFREEWNGSKAPARAAMYEDQQRRRRALSERAKAQREHIRASALSPAERRALSSVAAMDAARERKALADAIKDEREAFRAERPQDYRSWVADRAQEGDPAAIRQLRGWAYQDRRTARAMERADAAAERGPSLMASDGQAHDTTLPPAHALDRLTYTVDRGTGDLSYRLDGGDVFRHSGRWMRYSEAGQQNREAIEAGLLIAREAYGGQPLKITGPEIFRQRVVAVAIERGLDVKFSDPDLERQRVEGVRARQEARARPDWSRHRGMVASDGRGPQRPPEAAQEPQARRMTADEAAAALARPRPPEPVQEVVEALAIQRAGEEMRAELEKKHLEAWNGTRPDPNARGWIDRRRLALWNKEAAADEQRVQAHMQHLRSDAPDAIAFRAKAWREKQEEYGRDHEEWASGRMAALAATSSQEQEKDVAAPEPPRDEARARREAEVRALAEKQRQQAAEREQQQERGRDDDNDNTPEVSR